MGIVLHCGSPPNASELVQRGAEIAYSRSNRRRLLIDLEWNGIASQGISVALCRAETAGLGKSNSKLQQAQIAKHIDTEPQQQPPPATYILFKQIIMSIITTGFYKTLLISFGI